MVILPLEIKNLIFERILIKFNYLECEMSMRSENYALWKIFNFWGKNVIFEKFGGKSVILKNLLHQNFEKIWKFHLRLG